MKPHVVALTCNHSSGGQKQENSEFESTQSTETESVHTHTHGWTHIDIHAEVIRRGSYYQGCRKNYNVMTK